MGEIADIQKALEEFAIEKNWKKYHTIRNLVLALGSEVGELQAEFRWLTEEETINLSFTNFSNTGLAKARQYSSIKKMNG